MGWRMGSGKARGWPSVTECGTEYALCELGCVHAEVTYNVHAYICTFCLHYLSCRDILEKQNTWDNIEPWARTGPRTSPVGQRTPGQTSLTSLFLLTSQPAQADQLLLLS